MTIGIMTLGKVTLTMIKFNVTTFSISTLIMMNTFGYKLKISVNTNVMLSVTIKQSFFFK
jgi:hypothetical protein